MCPAETDLYEQDLPLWSEQQASLLERLAAGERVNELIDWPNVIEELRDAGGFRTAFLPQLAPPDFRSLAQSESVARQPLTSVLGQPKS